MPKKSSQLQREIDEALYMAVAGRKAAEFDIKQGTIGEHRDASNSPSYRDAYDTVIGVHRGRSRVR